MKKWKTNMEKYLIPKMGFRVTITYLECPVTYLAMVCFTGKIHCDPGSLTMYKKNYLRRTMQSKTVSVLYWPSLLL